MNAEERARLLRLKRLEKIRAIAKQTAAREAAEAESTLSQLRMLTDRTGKLAADYGARRGSQDGASLRQLAGFVDGLGMLTRNTRADAQRAEAIADAKLRMLAEAERRRSAVEERFRLQEKLIARGAEAPALGSRKQTGTDLV
ncbi:hypothetical protein [Novosphingobium sp. 9U]|uniref:hypothetical protein n=1 Tax=Novosphingobium sp. 9U TaxID=2653158 RepID=UPI0012EFE6D3|nr:hypothetical protein [Novosphingobium sp. 9U]VWX53063.1 conserved hypothetical protein [Novosphingobium sp. 9U]